MKRQKDSSHQLEFLGSMCEDTTPLRGRIAILSSETSSSSDIMNRIIIFIEHAQSLSLFFITNHKALGESTSRSVNISDLLYSFSALLGPGNLLIFDRKHFDQVAVILILALCFFIFRILLFGYIVYLAIRKKEGSKALISIWRMIFKVQARVIYYFMASLWVNTASATLSNEMNIESEINYMVLVISTIMLVLEFAFAVFLQTQFEGFLPSKSFLASKSNVTETITLCQKFFNQIVRRVLVSVPTASIWINNIFLVISSAIRLKYYLRYLPAYRVESLRYQVYFLVTVFCLNIACLAQVVFQDYPVTSDFAVVFWIILSILLTKLTINYLDGRILKLALSDDDGFVTPEALLHRLIIMKHFFKKRSLPDKMTDKLNKNHLIVTTLIGNLGKAFGISSSSNCIKDFDFANKEKREELFTMYLENLLKKFPKNVLLRLYTAYHYAQKRKMYGLCIKTLSHLEHNSSWRITVSIAVLFENIRRIIQYDYSHHKNYLFDIDEYARSTSLVAKLKMKMAEQSQAQSELCQELISAQPNLVKLWKNSEKAVSIRKIIEKDMNNIFDCLPDYYLEPYIICAHYELILNHNYEKYLKYHDDYIRKLQKHEKILEEQQQLRIEHLYQEDTGLLVVSGKTSNSGDLLYCGGNIEEILGADITGSHLSAVTPPSMRLDTAKKNKTSNRARRYNNSESYQTCIFL